MSLTFPPPKGKQIADEDFLCRLCQTLEISKAAFLKPAPHTLGLQVKNTVKHSIEKRMNETEDFFRTVASGSMRRAPMEAEFAHQDADGYFRHVGEFIQRPKNCRLCQLIWSSISEIILSPSAAEYCSVRQFVKLEWKISYAASFADMRQNSGDPFAASDRFYLAIIYDCKEIGVNLVPVANDMLSPWTFGRILIDPEGLTDVRKLEGWIGACETWHKDTCEPLMPTKSKTFSIRVIDVCENCLIQKNFGCRYIALSYLWGQCNTFLTLKKNLACLEERESLSKYIEQIPWTIRDAICLTRRLGERYLWVDALCIIQDDGENKSDAIANMDAVYNHALVTIVASSGTDANAGLPGVRPGTRKSRQQPFQIQRDLRIMAVGQGIQHLDKSTYSTRAWT